MEDILIQFKALADKNRLRVVLSLMKHPELCACQINELLQVTGATASRHMGILLSSRLIVSRKKGRWVYYRLQKNKKTSFTPLLKWIESSLNNNPESAIDTVKLTKILACDPEELCRKQRSNPDIS